MKARIKSQIVVGILTLVLAANCQALSAAESGVKGQPAVRALAPGNEPDAKDAPSVKSPEKTEEDDQENNVDSAASKLEKLEARISELESQVRELKAGGGARSIGQAVSVDLNNGKIVFKSGSSEGGEEQSYPVEGTIEDSEGDAAKDALVLGSGNGKSVKGLSVRDWKLPTVPSSQEAAFKLIPNSQLGRLGQIVIEAPKSSSNVTAEVVIFDSANQQLASHFQARSFGMPAGKYAVAINGKRCEGVEVRAGHDSVMRVGVLSVTVNEPHHLHNPGGKEPFTDYFQSRNWLLPIGEVEVMINNVRERVTIEEGTITKF